MTGFQPLAPVEYLEQVVQPPRNAWVDKTARDMDIIVNVKRKWRAPNEEDAVPMTAKRYQTLHKHSRRIIDMNAHSLYLRTKQATAQLAQDEYNSAKSPPDGERPSTISFDERTKSFIEVIQKASIEIDAIEKFQTDVVSILNAKAETVDCAFCFPLYSTMKHHILG